MFSKQTDICVLFPGGRVKLSCFPDIVLDIKVLLYFQNQNNYSICVLCSGGRGRVKQSCFPDIELVGIGQPADAPFHSPPCYTNPTIAHYTYNEIECQIIVVIKSKHHFIVVFLLTITCNKSNVTNISF